GASVALVLAPDLDDAVSPTVSRAGYAIVREALTNALRHGTGTVQVAVELTERHVVLSVSNGARDVGAPGPGRGLVGMRERAEALGGVLSSGPCGRPADRAHRDGTHRAPSGRTAVGRAAPAEGEWCVQARLPKEAR